MFGWGWSHSGAVLNTRHVLVLCSAKYANDIIIARPEKKTERRDKPPRRDASHVALNADGQGADKGFMTKTHV